MPKRLFALLFLIACGSFSKTSQTSQTMRGDWCGTERAELHHAGQLDTDCEAGDFFACETARSECAAGKPFFCASKDRLDSSEVDLAGCVAGELRDGELCRAPNYDVASARRPRAEALFTQRCKAQNWLACYELGLVREHRGDLIGADDVYRRACDHAVGQACARAGSSAGDEGMLATACEHHAASGCDALEARITDAENHERMGNYSEAVRIYRLGCFKWVRERACKDLEAFRAHAKREADACESGETDSCQPAAQMLRASSQGPTDDARATSLAKRRP